MSIRKGKGLKDEKEDDREKHILNFTKVDEHSCFGEHVIKYGEHIVK